MARIEHTLVVDRPPDDVYAYLEAGERLTEWMEDEFRSVERAGDAFRYETTRGVKSTWRWVEQERPRRLVWRGERVTPMGPLGSVVPSGEYTLEPEGGGTRVDAVLAPETGGVLKAFDPLLARSLRKKWPEQLQRMKRAVESGA